MSASRRLLRWGGAVELLAATGIAGVAGYAITWIVFRWIGPASYATFAVFWAAVYLLVGALSGVQQEVARATRSIEFGTRTTPSRSRNLALVGSLVVAAIVAGSSPAWAPHALGAAWGLLTPPLAMGAGSYVAVAVLAGSFFGIQRWRPVAGMLVADPVLRLGALVVALQMTHDIVVLAWCVAAPFILVPICVWYLGRHRLIGTTEIDVGYRGLVWNVARTVLASASTAIMVSGFPLIVGLTSTSVPSAVIGNAVFVITLVRAPLIVTVMAMQSYLLVRFRDDRARAGRVLALLLAALAVVGAVLGVLAGAVGVPVIEWVSGGRTGLSDGFIVAVVVSSAAVAALTVTGSAILARSDHRSYVVGWLVAAVVTIIAMIVPMDFFTRLGIALLAGPLAGLVVHGIAIVRAGLRPGMGHRE